MPITINLLEKEELSVPYEKTMKYFDNIDLLLEENKNNLFSEMLYNGEKSFNFKTIEKSIAKKKIFLTGDVFYVSDKDKGMIFIKSNKNEDVNTTIDLRIKVVKGFDDNTVIFLKMEAELDFGFNRVINRSIRSLIEKEVRKMILNNIEKYKIN